MNKVLSLLMAFVFLNATSWAFPPNYAGETGGVSAANLAGVYSGVLVPSGASATPGTNGAISLGIFAIGIPGTGASTVLAQGAGVLFSAGAGYNLTLNGVLDPVTSTLSAIIEGVSNFTVTEMMTSPTGVVTTLTFSIFAEGALTAKISASQAKNLAVTGPNTAGAAQINGTGNVQTFSTVGTTGPIISSTILFAVTGFQSSATYSVPTLMITNPGT
jgi:hypothetical protein